MHVSLPPTNAPNLPLQVGVRVWIIHGLPGHLSYKKLKQGANKLAPSPSQCSQGQTGGAVGIHGDSLQVLEGRPHVLLWLYGLLAKGEGYFSPSLCADFWVCGDQVGSSCYTL